MEKDKKKSGLIVYSIETDITNTNKSFLLKTNEATNIVVEKESNGTTTEFELYGTIEHVTEKTIIIAAKKEDNIYECSFSKSLFPSDSPTPRIEVGDAIAVKVKLEKEKYKIRSRPLIIISSREANIVELFRRCLNNLIKAKALIADLLTEYKTIEKIIEKMSNLALKWWECPKLPGLTKLQSLSIFKEWNISRNYRQLFLFGLNYADINTYMKFVECDMLELIKVCLLSPSSLFMLDVEEATKIAELTNKKIDKPLHHFCRSLYEETSNGKMFLSNNSLTQIQKATLSYFPVKVSKEEVYLPYPFMVQTRLTEYFRNLLNKNRTSTIDRGEIIVNPIFSKEQTRILTIALNSFITLILGPGGSGKSLLTAGIYENLVAKNLSVILGCPTGMAAANLRKLLNSSAPRTLHYFLKREVSPKVLLIDEVSMLTPELLLRILDKFPSIQQLIMIGDPNQLPPVKGFGSVIATLEPLSCCHKLTETFRFGNSILDISSTILEGKTPESNESFEILKGDEDDIITTYEGLLDGKVLYQEIYILSPFNKVVDSINARVQKIIAERKNRKRMVKDCEDKTWVIGDKVMFLENNPECDVYNGQIGNIIDLNKDLVTVEFAEVVVSLKTRYNKSKIKKKYTDDNFEEGYTETKDLSTNLINLAYCMTIHKAQGSQAPIVLIYLPYSRRENFITNNLLYTAVTRAQQNVVLIGDIGTFERGCKSKCELIPLKLGDP